jgi:hypothetical protein
MGKREKYSRNNSSDSSSEYSKKERSKRYKERKSKKDYKKYPNDRKERYKPKRKFEFDSPPRQNEKDDVNRGLGVLSNIIPGMHNLSVQEILAKLNQYQKTSKEQRIKSEKKLYIGNIPPNIEKTQVK